VGGHPRQEVELTSAHVPEKACPALDAGWLPVFRKEHAQTRELHMRLVVAAIGRLRSGPESELAERYRKRAEQLGRRIGFRTAEIVEIRESRAPDIGKRMIEESIALANVIPDKAITVILDERGESLDSAALAALLARWRDDGRPAAVFVIGGDDGLAASLRDKAKLRLAFGAATWPHQLVRVMLLEQLYRAITILSGHPYHRA
jgi:23S rRNA (pseudouridine1915-N3)-methyltransferase